jgi:MFS family permease
VTLTVACVATLLVLVNFTAPLSTIQIIGSQLGAGPSGQTWILGAISVGLAASLLVAGSLADDRGCSSPSIVNVTREWARPCCSGRAE